MKNLQIVPLSKMEEMRKYFYEYLTELSEFDPDIKFDEKGNPIYDWFDCYWSDKDRFPIFFKIDNKIAGFTLIRELGNMMYEIAEFYMFPEYRKDSNAIYFATEITNFFEGEFTFATRFTNARAIRFWNKFAELFDSNSYCDDENWRTWTIRKNNFKEYNLFLHPTYYNLIKQGEKTLEGRLFRNEKKNFNIGDIITFYKEPENQETMKAIILDKYRFNNFEEMADKLKKEELGFANSTKEEMVQVYRTIYTKDDEETFGVIVFKIKTL
ncbi:MAG: ASCH domain-containing protein [Clostridia bacterium]|nr:ASCH domain-containing protein [Clostridia bacterium]MBQ9786055.1 ASCH domain-containing protein [Clostridia bacterium]